MDALQSLLTALIAGPLSSRELQTRLGVSQPTLSRLVRRAGTSVVRIGRGPATRYGRSALVFGTAPAVQLFTVSEDGIAQEVATIRALSSGEYLVDGHDLPIWLRGLSETGTFQSLPYFLYDLRPAGFLGRQLARRLAREDDYPEDPRKWSDREIGQYLLSRGDDLPGNLVVGGKAAVRVSQRTVARIFDREVEYPKLAWRALNDEAPGSSAAGEQPKFAIYQEDAGHVIVKFSSAVQTPDAERWRDLLVAEHRALSFLRRNDVCAAETRFFEIDKRVFLESVRFDRVGELGRIAAISMSMIDAEFAGDPLSWTSVALALRRQGLIDLATLEQVVGLETFGAWIGNTDMHLGNLSLKPTHRGFELLPVYDMLPMLYRPVQGQLFTKTLRPPVRTTANQHLWGSVGKLAVDYWFELADDSTISAEFRAIAAENAESIRRKVER